ncbi:MAG TPA: histidine triad nucleotide-binding protein [Clostridiaceae bacterium]|nr:histidine triad nucleotide-binding protein [Clostridiaceae bacterium]
MDCIFCGIVNNDIPSKKVYEDDKVVAFEDINPAAPVHVVIVPRKHISSLMDINDEDATLIGHIFMVAKKIATEKNISENGFRIVCNCGEDGGQTVKHLHFHLLGGRSFGWPPG